MCMCSFSLSATVQSDPTLRTNVKEFNFQEVEGFLIGRKKLQIGAMRLQNDSHFLLCRRINRKNANHPPSDPQYCLIFLSPCSQVERVRKASQSTFSTTGIPVTLKSLSCEQIYGSCKFVGSVLLLQPSDTNRVSCKQLMSSTVCFK